MLSDSRLKDQHLCADFHYNIGFNFVIAIVSSSFTLSRAVFFSIEIFEAMTFLPAPPIAMVILYVASGGPSTQTLIYIFGSRIYNSLIFNNFLLSVISSFHEKTLHIRTSRAVRDRRSCEKTSHIRTPYTASSCRSFSSTVTVINFGNTTGFISTWELSCDLFPILPAAKATTAKHLTGDPQDTQHLF